LTSPLPTTRLKSRYWQENVDVKREEGLAEALEEVRYPALPQVVQQLVILAS